MSELELHFEVVRIRLGGFLKERKSLQYLALVLIDEAQLPNCYRFVWSELERLAIFVLSLVILLGGKIFVCAGQVLSTLSCCFEQPALASATQSMKIRHRRCEAMLVTNCRDRANNIIEVLRP